MGIKIPTEFGVRPERKIAVVASDRQGNFGQSKKGLRVSAWGKLCSCGSSGVASRLLRLASKLAISLNRLHDPRSTQIASKERRAWNSPNSKFFKVTVLRK